MKKCKKIKKEKNIYLIRMKQKKASVCIIVYTQYNKVKHNQPGQSAAVL